MQNFLLNFYQTFSFAIFHIIDLGMILSNHFFSHTVYITLLFPFIVNHQLNTQNTTLIEYSRYELKTKISENFRVTRGGTSRDRRRMTD